MAELNKTQAIKDLLSDNPNLMPLEISTILKEKGIDVTKGFASVVKSNFNKKNRLPKAEASFSAKKKRIKSSSASKGFDISILLEVKKICDKYGKDEILDAISTLEKLS
jgi:hypothetical protein